MDFCKTITSKVAPGQNTVVLIDIIFLLVVFLIIAPFFTGQSPLQVRLPGAVTSDIAHDGNITVIVSSENILYYDNKVVTLEEFKGILSRLEDRRRPVLIKADRRASLGRIVDLWNLGRSVGIERIDVASDREE